MKKKERIISLFVDKSVYEKGEVDITERLYKIIPEDKIESIKYLIPSSTEDGIYYTIYVLEKKESSSGLGFTS